jgi:photosystem II stability/assembly factor-like uncharacterized protein
VSRGAVAAASLAAGLAGAAAAQAPVVEPQPTGTAQRLQAVWAVSAEVAWASGAGGTWARTTDGGRTWTARVVPGADSLEFRDVHAFDRDRAVLLAAGPGDRSRLYRTEDGGRTWALVWTNPEPRAFYDCIDFQGSFGLAVSDAVDGRFPLLRTRNGGRSWEPYAPPGHDRLRAVDGEGAFAASGTCLEVAGDGGFRVVTAIGGRVLRFGPRGVQVAEPPLVRGPPAAGLAAVAFRSPQVGLVAGGDLGRPGEPADNVARTRDGGRTWVVAGRPFPGPVYGLAWTRGRRGAVAVAVGPGGAAWSDDDGATWRPLAEGSFWGVGFTHHGTGWLAGPGGRVVRVRFR